MSDTNTNIKRIKYFKDSFLDEFKRDFQVRYYPLYKLGKAEDIVRAVDTTNNIIESDIEYEYIPLRPESVEYDPDIIQYNMRTVWKSLHGLTRTQAELEKIWVSLAHTDYINYSLACYDTYVKCDNIEKEVKNLKSRTYFTNGSKRSLAIHNLASYWWLAYYFIDESNSNPFHLLDFLVSKPYRGNAIVLLSSNIISTKEIAIGLLDAIRELVENRGVPNNRSVYAQSTALLNKIGGIRILDTLTRQEIKDIILENYPY